MPLRYCPSEKKASEAAFPAELVLGVVKVGEVLDLDDRQQPGQCAAQGGSEHRLLVEQRVEHPRAAEPLLQAAGHAVDAALRRDVLPKDDSLRPRREQVVRGWR